MCIWIAVLLGLLINLILVAFSLPATCYHFCSAVVSGLPCLYYFLFLEGRGQEIPVCLLSAFLIWWFALLLKNWVRGMWKKEFEKDEFFRFRG